jgi:uncharacterized protein YegL
MEQNFNDVDFAGSNFDINDIATEETINAVFIIDLSPSVSQYLTELNAALADFTQEMQKSHVADNLFVSIIEFDENVRIKSGFQPIINLKQTTFTIAPRASGTALYDAVKVGMKNALEWRDKLQSTGVNSKTLVFTITDGEDNSSSYNAASEVKQMHVDIQKDERNAFGFTSILFGVGTAAYFEGAQKEMGIQHLSKVGTTGKELRKMISFISSSISSASAGNTVAAPTF